ncbi:hypothetical protein [Halobacterium noricense]|uniref:hypothetical protein n=1 Tax=Halobacterium noricense TaxID=223182 RepID=UPI001E329907|nr:hypothetical protein [Halobacterium noricense]UHH24373.1 hypothetical protein LT974_10275 [Halobacterium noricense]
MPSTSLLDRGAARSLLRSLVLVLGVLVGYVVVWRLLDPGAYLFAIFGTYAALVGFLLLQVVRASAMETWRRRAAALATAPASTGAIFAGLRPRPACLDLSGCGEGLTLQPVWFVGFVLLTTALIAADTRWEMER